MVDRSGFIWTFCPCFKSPRLGITNIVVKFNKSPGRRVTQREIAELAGVSHVAVSYALHRPHESRISEDKRDEIQRIALELGYRSRPISTHTIGFVIPAGMLRLAGSTSVIVHTHEALAERNYRMILVATKGLATEGPLPSLDQKSVDGVIFAEHYPAMHEMLPAEVPWVLMADADEANLPSGIDQVSTDTAGTMAAITRYLLEKGHRSLCMVTGNPGIPFHEHMKTGFKRELRAGGLGENAGHLLEIQGNENIPAPLAKCLTGPDAPTAIVGGSVGKTLVCLNVLQGLGYRVPDQISLISFTDSDELTWMTPPLSATTALGRDMVDCAVDRLLKKLKHPGTPPEQISFTGEIVERGSVANGPGKSETQGV